MKQSLKITGSLFVFLLMILGLSSCDNDSGEYLSYDTNIVTVETNEEGYAESFLSDDGISLFVMSSSTNYKPVNKRAVIAFNYLDQQVEGYDKVIHLEGYFYDVLTKPAIYIPQDDEHLQDSIGYDKIKVFSVWSGQEYINIRFGYNMSRDSKHMVNLVADVKDLEQVGDEPIKLTFRHHVVKGSELYGSDPLYVSFNIGDYIKANQGKKEELTFEINWEEYNGDKKQKIVKVKVPKDPIDPPVIEE